MTYLYYFIFMITTSIVIWFQTVAPIKFSHFLHKYSFVVYLIGFLGSILYVEASKIGATVFPNAWSLRFVAFSINTIFFAILTHFFIGADFTPKTLICFGLSVAIILIQCFWD